MAYKAVVLLAQGFEEIEAATPIDVLRRAGVEVTVAGIGGTAISGAHGLVYVADTELSAPGGDYDLLVIPGGMPGAKNIGETPAAKALAEKMANAGKMVTAICAAPVMTLGNWGLLKGRPATCYPGMESMFPADVEFRGDRVVTDGNIITSRGPGTALEFSLALVRTLVGEEKAAELSQGMLAK